MAPATLPDLSQGNLVKRVFDILHENILSGQFIDGERLPRQEFLGERLGVSRTVVREALNKLAVLRLVEIRHGSGTYVRAAKPGGFITPVLEALMVQKESMQELMETRYYLEQTLVRLATKRINEEGILKLSWCVEDMRECVAMGDTARFAKRDLEFHLALAEASGNGVLRHILEFVRDTMLRFMKDFAQIPGAPKTSLRHHAAIADAVKRRDPLDAERCMVEHLRFVIGILRTEYEYNLEI